MQEPRPKPPGDRSRISDDGSHDIGYITVDDVIEQVPAARHLFDETVRLVMFVGDRGWPEKSPTAPRSLPDSPATRGHRTPHTYDPSGEIILHLRQRQTLATEQIRCEIARDRHSHAVAELLYGEDGMPNPGRQLIQPPL